MSVLLTEPPCREEWDGDIDRHLFQAEEGAIVDQPIQSNRWQSPLSLAQGVIAIAIGALSLLGYAFAFHARFVAIELNAVRQAEDIRMLTARWDKFSEKLDSSFLILTKLEEKNEWMAAWIKAGGEQRK